MTSTQRRGPNGQPQRLAVFFYPPSRYTSEMHTAHFIGIAGKGMSAVALLLKERGWTISGSDEGFYPPVSDYLVTAGIPFSNGYRKENIPAEAELIVIGKNAKLVPETNEEVRAALESGKPVKSFPDILEELTQETDNIVVAGSYGKSTCTALLSWCLREAGKDPSYFIGEITNGLPCHAHLGKGSAFVLEGDEYPSSNWDTRSKFLHYHPKSVLLVSATHDHVNVYPTHEDYLKPFRELISIVPKDGLLVVNRDEEFAYKLSESFSGKRVSYGRDSESDWYPENCVFGSKTTFDLMHKGERVGSLSTTLLGMHNIENIVGASALLLEKNLLSFDELQSSIKTFAGVKRRLELLTKDSNIPVYEGFGSSYEKARSAIEAVRLHYPDRRLIVAFEPHTFGWRNRANLPWYDHAFDDVDTVFVAPPETQGASTHDQLSHEEILERIGSKALAYNIEAITESLTEDSVVLILTSGSLGGTLPTLVDAISHSPLA